MSAFFSNQVRKINSICILGVSDQDRHESAGFDKEIGLYFSDLDIIHHSFVTNTPAYGLGRGIMTFQLIVSCY